VWDKGVGVKVKRDPSIPKILKEAFFTLRLSPVEYHNQFSE
jgi:hypothetical protein